MNPKKLKITQLVRECKEGGGVSGVAYQLEQGLKQEGINVKTVTWETLAPKLSKWLRRLIFIPKICHIAEVVLFSLFGSLFLAKNKKYFISNGVCTLVHNDALGGDIYINHGLHKAMLKSRPDSAKLILFNPIHLFLLFREGIRTRFQLFRYIICLSDAGIKEYRENYPYVPIAKLKAIPNGVSLSRFAPSMKTQKILRKQWNIPDNDFVALFVGYEFKRKGFFTILNSLKDIKTQMTLVAVGGQDQEIEQAREETKTLLPHVKIIFIGRTTDVVPYFQMADIFIMPSRYEACPLVGLEAAACGLPLLMADVGGIGCYLKEGQNGYFVQTGNEVKTKIEQLASDRNLTKRMGTRSLEIADFLTWEHMTQQYITLAKQVLFERS